MIHPYSLSLWGLVYFGGGGICCMMSCLAVSNSGTKFTLAGVVGLFSLEVWCMEFLISLAFCLGSFNRGIQ